jgi:AsmA protein
VKKVIKWLLIVVGSLAALLVLALILVPMFVDVQKYKPYIEEKASEAIGRPVTLGGDLHLSLFPWVGVSFSDLKVGNPPAFKEKNLMTVKSFEARVKLLPLLSREVEVKRFVLDGAQIVLVKNKGGLTDWEGIGKPETPSKAPKEEKKPAEGEAAGGLPIKTLAVGEFAITNGSILWIDHVSDARTEVSDVNLRLKDVSLDRPIHLLFSAKVDKKPLSLEGSIGPVGKEPGKGTIPLDLAFKALQEVSMTVKGRLVDPAVQPQFDLAIQVSPFSPRKVFTAMGKEFPVATQDPKALSSVALKASLKGSSKAVTISDGLLNLDESKLTFSAKAKDFSRPDLSFAVEADKLNLDRYLPPESEKKAPAEGKGTVETPEKKVDYGPLRKPILDGTIKVGQLEAHGAKMQEILMKITGKDGRFRMDPLSLKLYQGGVAAKATVDVSQSVPTTAMELVGTGIEAGPLMRDVMKKDFLEGKAQVNLTMTMTGDTAERIKSSLNGKGEFVFLDGAVKGFDLAGMVRNAKAAFGLEGKSQERPRTDFAELRFPFTIKNGVMNTPDTSLVSPLIRVKASGDVNLVKETLDMRVEPKFVGTIKGQGDTKERSGIMVPVLVTGTFSSPKFSPDLKGILQQQLPSASEMKNALQSKEKLEEEKKQLEEKAKGLLKGLPFGK